MTTVLIIDDSLDYLKSLSMILENAGYDAVLTAEPQRALRLCEDIDFDLILCGLELRDAAMSDLASTRVGVNTLASLCRSNPGIPVIATGQIISEDMLTEIGRVGVKDAIPKHLPANLLLKNLAKLLGGVTL